MRKTRPELFSGGGGVIYAINSNGDLLRTVHNARSGRQIRPDPRDTGGARARSEPKVSSP